MPKANFYLLKQNSEDAKQHLACRLAEQQSRQGQRVYLHTANADDAAALDQLLWQYTAESFLPHAVVGTAGAELAMVHIGFRGKLPEDVGCVVNLSGEPLPETCVIEAVAEFVLNDAGDKERGRVLWQEYKQRGWALQHHAL